MYYQDKINIENFLYQMGLSVNAYDLKIKTHKKIYSPDISDVSIEIYGPRKYHIGHASIFMFKENGTKAKFSKLFIVNIQNSDIEYPTDLTVIKENKEMSEQFTKIEDYIKLLYILSNKKIDYVYIDIRCDIDFTESHTKIENVKAEIDSRAIMEYFKDNSDQLDPAAYIDRKLSENNIIYEHTHINSIVTAFEMLKI